MSETMQAYCVKCKTRREILNPQPVYTRTGTPATQGQCAVCGTNLFRMGDTPAHASIPKPDNIEKPARKAAAKTSDSKKKSDKPKKKTTGKTAASKKAAAQTSDAKKSSTKAAAGRKKGAKHLVIVESPAKARSVGNFLGRDFMVIASKGHVRDLLATQLSVDIGNDFEPKYRVPNEKRDTVKEIKAAVQTAEKIYLATDPDREGEAIAWHLVAAADIPLENTQRVVFHEITDKAIHEAFSHPREIDMRLVNAQQARRILDRLVGYQISPLLWEKVRNRLSAGRVQSIALRMVVDREREIDVFVPVEYWTIDVELSKEQINGKKPESFVAHLAKINGEDANLHTEAEVLPHVAALQKSLYRVLDVKIGTRQRKPSPPFTTSTLQQEASRRLGFNAGRTMQAAQKLYEGIDLGGGNITGLITYMRTDSLNISEQAQQEAREFITKQFGTEFMPAQPPKYKTKAKGAQEAHEAIRPTIAERVPDNALKAILDAGTTKNSRDLFRLYKLIWERFIASQMSNAVYDTMRVEIAAGETQDNMPYLLRASGNRLKFAGFLALYEDAKDEDATVDPDEGRILPEMSIHELLNLLKVLPEQHFTQPPPRYTEASLVRTLEEYGIGRPSTYAPTVAVIQDRDYVTREDRRMVPTDTGKIVSDLLVRFFPEEMDYQFTARMEEQLDDIADTSGEWKPMLREFYAPFEQRLTHARDHMPAMKQAETIARACPVCGGQLVIKYGRFGKFIGCANHPTCTHTEPYLELTGVSCPKCGATDGGELVERKTRKGRTFYGCSRYPACDFSAWQLPKTAKTPTDDDYEPEEMQDIAG